MSLLSMMEQVIARIGLKKLRIPEINRKRVAANAQLQKEDSEWEQAERLLREKEDRYRTLFNSSRDAIMILSPTGRFIDGNPSTLRLFGCQNKEEFIRMTHADLSPRYQPDGVLSAIKEQEMVALAMAKDSHFFEWRHLRLNGEEFFATVLLTKMYLQGEAVLQSTVRDVTERKLAEQKMIRYQNHLEELVAERTAELAGANQRLQQDIMLRKEAEGQLRESQQMLQLVLDNIPQLVFWKDRDSVYLGCNRNFAGAAGVESPQGLVGKTDYDLPWTMEESEFYRECDRRVMESDTPEFHIIETQRQADGKQAWVDTNKIPLHDSEGRVVGILGTYEDITERQKAEIALRESEERLKEANQELEAFTYTVSHDLRTPLTVILGYADLLRKSLRDRMDEQELNCLSAIHDSGIRMEELMEDLLALARAGQIERPTDPFDAGEVVNDVACGLAEIITKAGVSVAVGDLPTLRVPRTLLFQVFHNLIGNAIRYGCKPGDVIEVGGERKEEKVRLYVRDYGPGIPEEERGLIFEAFYRGTTGKDNKGTGIGLATVQKIARLFDGRAWVEDTPGGGSTFWVELVDVP
jgi:PAS domain S-box-containing protein